MRRLESLRAENTHLQNGIQYLQELGYNLENLAPEIGGLTEDALRQTHARLIACGLSNYRPAQSGHTVGGLFAAVYEGLEVLGRNLPFQQFANREYVKWSLDGLVENIGVLNRLVAHLKTLIKGSDGINFENSLDSERLLSAHRDKIRLLLGEIFPDRDRFVFGGISREVTDQNHGAILAKIYDKKDAPLGGHAARAVQALFRDDGTLFLSAKAGNNLRPEISGDVHLDAYPGPVVISPNNHLVISGDWHIGDGRFVRVAGTKVVRLEDLRTVSGGLSTVPSLELVGKIYLRLENSNPAASITVNGAHGTVSFIGKGYSTWIHVTGLAPKTDTSYYSLTFESAPSGSEIYWGGDLQSRYEKFLDHQHLEDLVQIIKVS